MKRSRFSALALTLVAVLALGGCASIPRSGGVNAGHPIDRAQDPDVLYIPRGPERDASPEEILNGFIEAASSPANNYATAREFLDERLAGSWKPDARAILEEAEHRRLEFDGEDPTAARLSVVPVANVDDRGQYTAETNGRPMVMDFGFRQVQGQWRISKAPDGVILDPIKFRDVFKPYSLRFFDPTWTHLVPEVRWFPSRASTSTNIVKALLAGPSEWLAGAVSSAFPEGTRLSADSVPTANSVAEVDLTREASGIDDLTLRRMQLQLTASLSDVTAIDAVNMRINGVPQEIAPLTLAAPRTDSRPLVLTEAGFGFLTEDMLERLPVAAPAVEALDPGAAAAGPDQEVIAVRSAAGVSAVRAGAAVVVDARGGLIGPAVDPSGIIWTVPQESPNELYVINAANEQKRLPVSWPEASEIVSLQVSQDGARVLALVRTGGKNSLLISGIERDNTGLPVRLGEPIRVAAAAGKPLSATWVDETSVASLASSESGLGQIVHSTVGGRSDSLVSVPGAVQLVGGSTIQQFRLLTEAGDLKVWRSGAWQDAAENILLIAPMQGSVR
ncbi:GerMN domain-containing protein [Mycetocola spongiae]|uniref:GerMN domain-containing protein n=1 Tax=Mycetocola spongiae TaxID=2859226 RepID=UPI001CF283AE|nr:GerMN domain-containing protein [Mycetocola spongiae]UCR90302.1 GerMN domain-containing protein [Mycetocola spongiae]